MNITDVLPCPHCGGKAWLRDNQACGWRIECDECQIGGLDYLPRPEAIERWNARWNPSEMTRYIYMRTTDGVKLWSDKMISTDVSKETQAELDAIDADIRNAVIKAKDTWSD